MARSLQPKEKDLHRRDRHSRKQLQINMILFQYLHKEMLLTSPNMNMLRETVTMLCENFTMLTGLLSTRSIITT